MFLFSSLQKMFFIETLTPKFHIAFSCRLQNSNTFIRVEFKNVHKDHWFFMFICYSWVTVYFTKASGSGLLLHHL